MGGYRRAAAFLVSNVLAICVVLIGPTPAEANLAISCNGCGPAVFGGTAILATPSLAPPSYTLLRNPNDNSGLPGGANVTPIVLVPDNAANGANLAFNTLLKTGGNPVGSATTFCDLPCTVPGFGLAAKWSSPGSNLTDYLKDSLASGPALPFNALLAATDALDPGAAGYFVYAPLFGVPVNFAPGDDPTVDFSNIASFPVGTIFTAIITDFDVNTEIISVPARDSTGTDGALILGAPIPVTVPEPLPLLTIAAGALLLQFLRRRDACGTTLH